MKKKGFVSAVIGLGAGFLNGLFGSGGGALVVPAVQKFLNVDTHEAHASAIAVMLPMTVVSAVVYMFRAKPEFLPAFIVSAGGVIGGFLGARLMTKIPPEGLRKIFGIFIIAAAIRMLL